jgi:HTH-like domain
LGQKYEAGVFDEHAAAADLLQRYETRIAALERLVGTQALELELVKGGCEKRTPAEKREYVRHCRRSGLSIAEGCPLMGIARSTFYDLPTAVHYDTAICGGFEFYGRRRVRVEVRHRGMIVNHKKIRRLMREHDLQPRRRRRHLETTDSDHDQPVYPNRKPGT